MTVPAHVPKTRAVANASKRSGPTVEDLSVISTGRTPLFAEITKTQVTGTNPAAIMSNPIHLELYKSRINDFLYSTYMSPGIKSGYVYVPGFLTGVWEGSFMVSFCSHCTAACQSCLFASFIAMRYRASPYQRAP